MSAYDYDWDVIENPMVIDIGALEVEHPAELFDPDHHHMLRYPVRRCTDVRVSPRYL